MSALLSLHISPVSSVGRFVDSSGTDIAINNEDAIIGSAGFRIKRSWGYDRSNDGGLSAIYGKAYISSTIKGGETNLNFGASNSTNSAEVEFKQTWADVGMGTAFSISDRAQLFADVDVESGIDQDRAALGGRVGFRASW